MSNKVNITVDQVAGTPVALVCDEGLVFDNIDEYLEYYIWYRYT